MLCETMFDARSISAISDRNGHLDTRNNRFIQGFLIACLVLAHGFLYRFDPVGK